MSCPCTPQEIISRAHSSVSRATSPAALSFFSDQGAGAINCLFDLGLIDRDAYREASHSLESLAARRFADLARGKEA